MTESSDSEIQRMYFFPMSFNCVAQSSSDWVFSVMFRENYLSIFPIKTASSRQSLAASTPALADIPGRPAPFGFVHHLNLSTVENPNCHHPKDQERRNYSEQRVRIGQSVEIVGISYYEAS